MKTSLPSFAQYRWAAWLDGGARNGGQRCCIGPAGAWGASASEWWAAAAATRGAEEDAAVGRAAVVGGRTAATGAKAPNTARKTYIRPRSLVPVTVSAGTNVQI